MISDYINIKNILDIYENGISKNIRNKGKLFKFEVNKMQNIENIILKLKSGKVINDRYNIFLIYEPKCRLVMSLSVHDKIINHFLARYILEKKLSKYLSDKNVATRKGMGTKYALDLVEKYINTNKNKYKNLYVLKLDISKYFYSIDHDILKGLLKERLDSEEYNLLANVIDSTNEAYINESIKYYKENKNVDIPYYHYKKGLPIGNMTSQFLSIFYLYKLDHYIVHNLKCKNYVRYMDDFIIIDNDLDKLRYAQKKIIEILNNEYKLIVNPKKTCICNLRSGFSFLGFTFKLKNNKTIIDIKKENLNKIKKKIKYLKWSFTHGRITHQRAFCSIMTYTYGYRYGKDKIRAVINRYWYEK